MAELDRDLWESAMAMAHVARRSPLSVLASIGYEWAKGEYADSDTERDLHHYQAYSLASILPQHSRAIADLI